jgi:hypothetical protein
MVAELEIIVGVHDIAHALLHVVIVYVAPGDRHSIHGHDAAGVLALVAKRVRQAEHRLDVALSLQTLRNSIVSSGESTKYMRRILPSKH